MAVLRHPLQTIKAASEGFTHTSDATPACNGKTSVSTCTSSVDEPDSDVELEFHADVELVVDMPGRLVAPRSLGYRYYVLPQCNHDDDTVYPHKDIQDINAVAKCISHVRARNMCMLYRMRVMLSGNIEWAQAVGDRKLNMLLQRHRSYTMASACAQFVRQLAGRTDSEDEKNEISMDVETKDKDMPDYENHLTPIQRGDILDNLLEQEFFQPWQAYRFVGQFLSQAEDDEITLDDSDYDPELVYYDDISRIYHHTKIQCMKLTYHAIRKFIVGDMDDSDASSTQARNPDSTAHEGDDDSSAGQATSFSDPKYRDIRAERFPLQAVTNFDHCAVKGDYAVCWTPGEQKILILSQSSKDMEKLVDDGIACVYQASYLTRIWEFFGGGPKRVGHVVGAQEED